MTSLTLPGVLCSFLGWTKPTSEDCGGHWRGAQREDDRSLKEETGEDEQVLCGLEGRLQNIHLHTSSTGTTNCLKTRCQWSNYLPIFVSGNDLLLMQPYRGPPLKAPGQLQCRRSGCTAACTGRVMFHPLSPKVNGYKNPVVGEGVYHDFSMK